MRLKPVGFFRELSYGSPQDSSIYDTVAFPLPDENKILEYLNSALVFIVAPGIEKDVLAPENVVGATCILTDGVWAWPKSLSYYLENYHVRLPTEFLEHIKIRNYVVPKDVNLNDLEFPG